MNRPRSHLRSPLIRRIQRHASVATMFRGPSPLIESRWNEMGQSPVEILPSPALISPDIPPSQDSEILPAASQPQPDLAQRQPLAPSPTPSAQQTPGVSQPPASSTPSKTWYIPKILRKWQESRAAAKAEKSKTLQDHPTLPTSTVSPAPILQAKPIQSTASTASVPQAQQAYETPVQSPVITPQPPVQNPIKTSISPAIQRQSVPLSSPQPPSVPPSESPATIQTDSTWGRLETIMRKHEEKRQAELASPSETPVQRQGPTQAVPPPRAGDTPVAQITPSSGVIQARALPTPSASETPASPSTPQPETPDSSWKRLQTIMRKHEEKQALEAESQPSTPELVQPSKAEMPPKPTASSPSTPPRLQKAPQPRTPSTSDVPQSASSKVDLSSPVKPSMPSSTKPPSSVDADPDQTQLFYSTPEPETATPPEQPMPLESAWPVQRVAQKPSSTSTPSPENAPTFIPSAPSLHPEEEAVLRKVSETAKTGQPTDSHVELILPRSPRPASLQKPSQVSSAETSSTSSPETTAGTSRFNEPNAPPEMSHQEMDDRAVTNTLIDTFTSPISFSRSETIIPVIPPSNPLSTSPQSEIPRSSITPISQPLVQRSSSPTDPSSLSLPPPSQPSPLSSPPPAAPVQRAPAQSMISTEIGPLPSDLWQLIGQTPPASQSAPSALPTPTQTQPLRPTSSPTAPVLPTPTKVPPPMTSYEAPKFSPDPTSSSKTTRTASSSPPIQRMSQSQPLEAVIQQSMIQRPGPQPTHPPQSQPYPVLQRAEGTSAPTNTNTPAAPSEPGQGAATLSEQDLDKIARQVYAELRQKLSIERERARGWMK